MLSTSVYLWIRQQGGGKRERRSMSETCTNVPALDSFPTYFAWNSLGPPATQKTLPSFGTAPLTNPRLYPQLWLWFLIEFVPLILPSCLLISLGSPPSCSPQNQSPLLTLRSVVASPRLNSPPALALSDGFVSFELCPSLDSLFLSPLPPRHRAFLNIFLSYPFLQRAWRDTRGACYPYNQPVK